MTVNFRQTSPIKSNGDIIDLSNLNIFDATKEIIMTSTYFFSKNFAKKVKYKVSTPNIKNLLNEFPVINNSIELIF